MVEMELKESLIIMERSLENGIFARIIDLKVVTFEF